jgi:hypothetical protein
MEPPDRTLEILKDIRNEVRRTYHLVDGLRDEVRGTQGGIGRLADQIRGFRADLTDDLDETHNLLARLERGQSEFELHLSTGIAAVASAVRDVRDLVLEDRAARSGRYAREV